MMTSLTKSLLIRVLKRIVADFKSVEKKFEQQGIEKDTVKKYLDLFKSLRDSQKLKQEDRNIDSWGKKPFTEFKEFLDSKSEEKKHVRQLKPMEGAELVTENDDWFVYHISDFEASKRYGEGTSWCITQEKWWNKYKARTNFYFIISKKFDENNEMFKIAVAVPTKGTETYWDAKDRSHKELPKELNIPAFEIKKKEFSGNMTKVEQLVDEFKAAWENQEEYYNTLEAYDSYTDYLYNRDNLHNDYRRHLDSDTDSLVDDLCTLYRCEDDKDEQILDILFECCDEDIRDNYYATNEISSVSVGDQECSIDDDLRNDVDELSDEEKSELREKLDDESVYVNEDISDFVSLGREDNRIVLILNEEKLKEHIKVEEERVKTSKESTRSKLNRIALTSSHPKVVLEALNKVKDKDVLLKLSESNKTKSKDVKIAAIKKLCTLYKKDSETQKILQKIVRKNKEETTVKRAAVEQVIDQDFLKKVVLYKSKDYSFQYVQKGALLNIRDKDFVKKVGLKNEDLHETALDIINTPEYAKQMLSIKKPLSEGTYSKIITMLPDTEQDIFKKLVLNPKEEGYRLDEYKKNALKRITDQKFLVEIFKKEELKEELREAALYSMDQKTLERVYDSIKEDKGQDSSIRKIADLAKNDSLIKKMVVDTKDNQYEASDLLEKIKDEKWMLQYLRKCKKEYRNEIIKWMRYGNKERYLKLCKIFKIKPEE